MVDQLIADFFVLDDATRKERVISNTSYQICCFLTDVFHHIYSFLMLLCVLVRLYHKVKGLFCKIDLS